MWLLISIAHAVCEGPEVLDVIPLGGELRKGSWIRLQSGAEFPEAELALVEDPERVYQMTEQLAAAETPEGWVAVQIPDEVYDGDYELHLYDAGEDVGCRLDAHATATLAPLPSGRLRASQPAVATAGKYCLKAKRVTACVGSTPDRKRSAYSCTPSMLSTTA